MDKMHDEKDFKNFLKKVDDINSIIKDLNTDNEKLKDAALLKADNYLHKANKQEPGGFDKTVINKIEDEASPRESKQEISAEDFMKDVEEDAARRTKRKKENKDKSLVWKGKGNAHFMEEKFADAVECYSEAIRLTPDEVIYYSNRAQALIKVGKYEAAVKDCEDGIKLNKQFVKMYVHQGRALTGLKRYDEAIASFNKVLKINKKQQKMINEYINGVEKERELVQEEDKATALLQEGDEKMHQIKELISKLRKGFPPNIEEVNDVISKLKGLIVDENHRIIFRLVKGFNIFNDHPAINRLLKSSSFSKEELKIVVNVINMMSNVITENEENSDMLSSFNYVLSAAIESLKIGHGLKEQFAAVHMFYKISQFNCSRKNLLNNASIKQLLNKTLSILEKGGDLAMVAMGMINNLAIDPSFVPQFEEKLSTDFIPGVIKMMELLSLSFPEGRLSTFLPVMASSISTIANLFHDADLRKKRANNDKTIWTASLQLMTKYSTRLDNKSILKVVLSTLGMLMNLSTQQIGFEKEFIKKWIDLSIVLIRSSFPVIVERCCGILNHTTGCNAMMVKEIIDKKLYLDFLDIVKGDNFAAKRHTIKCIALCVIVDERVRESIHSCKVLPALLESLHSTDELVVGNTALVFAHCHENKSIVLELVDCELIKNLLIHATNDELSKTVRHNCAIAIGKYCLADPRYLQQLRDLHGLEILHEVMKENSLV